MGGTVTQKKAHQSYLLAKYVFGIHRDVVFQTNAGNGSRIDRGLQQCHRGDEWGNSQDGRSQRRSTHTTRDEEWFARVLCVVNGKLSDGFFGISWYGRMVNEMIGWLDWKWVMGDGWDGEMAKFSKRIWPWPRYFLRSKNRKMMVLCYSSLPLRFMMVIRNTSWISIVFRQIAQ